MRSWCPFLIPLLLCASTAAADAPPPEGVHVPSTAAEEVTPSTPADDTLAIPSLVDLAEVAPETFSVEELQRRRELSERMHAELAALDDAIREQVAALESAMQKATAGAVPSGPESDREIEALKRSLVVESLAIQARYAREVGAETLAAEIDAAVAHMLNPVIDTTTVDRTPRPRHRAQQR